MKKLFLLTFFISAALLTVLIYCHNFSIKSKNNYLLALSGFYVSPVSCSSFSYASSNEQYARIKFAGVFLYKTPTLNESYINMHFEIPASYFVKLLSEANINFYRAQYMEEIGYVKKFEVQPIIGTPEHPFAAATVRVFSSDGATLKDAPYYASDSIISLSQSQTILQYIGRINGEEAILGRGSIWYYCKYGNSAGYVYGGLCDMLTNIPTNSEKFGVSQNPFATQSISYIENLRNGATKYTIISLVLLPSFVIFYLLFMKIRPKNKAPAQKLKKVKSIKPQYLYDDNEL